MSRESEIQSIILWDSELVSDDKVLLCAIRIRQSVGELVSHEQLSESLGILPESVARRLRKLRKLGIIASVQEGQHGWRYSFPKFERSIDALSAPTAPCPTRTEPLHPDGRGWKGIEPLHPLCNRTWEDNVETISSGEGQPLQPCPSPDPTTEESLTATLRGPQDELRIVMQKVIDAGTKVGSPAQAAIRDRFKAPSPSSRWEEFKAKKPENYKTPDIEMLFRQEWELAKLPGRPFLWTAKDRGQVKRLLEEQGGASTAALVSYVVKRWESIRRRYKLTGAPSVGVMYGYRRSWLPEALNGEPKTQTRGPAEWTDPSKSSEECESHDFGGATGWGNI